MAWSAARWRSFYADERAALGDAGLAALLDAGEALLDAVRGGGAPTTVIAGTRGGDACERARSAEAWVFPHARLAACGAQVAAAALAVVRSGADRVLALGVLHGGREADRDAVAAARRGDVAAIARLRRVHGDGVAGDEGIWREEFSLDAFAALLPLVAARCGRPGPRLIARFPFLAGDDPTTLPGLDDLRALIADGCAVVATADPMHHGAGYGTPPSQRRDDRDPTTLAVARAGVDAQLAALAERDWPAFRKRCTADGSDFRDNGAALAVLLPGRGEVVDMRLVDYAATLSADRPTWVAAGLVGWVRGCSGRLA